MFEAKTTVFSWTVISRDAANKPHTTTLLLGWILSRLWVLAYSKIGLFDGTRRVLLDTRLGRSMRPTCLF
jgi:hypothetical protein